jgi:hypothetical protein
MSGAPAPRPPPRGAGARRSGAPAPQQHAPPQRAHAPQPAQAPLPALPAGARLSAAQLLRFERKGHVATRRVLSPEELTPFVAPLTDALSAHRLDAYRHRVAVLCPRDVATSAAALRSVEEARALLRRHAGGGGGSGDDDVGFLQVFNLHREAHTRAGAAARALVVSALLARGARRQESGCACLCPHSCFGFCVLCVITGVGAPRRRGGAAAGRAPRAAVPELRVHQGAGHGRHQLAQRCAARGAKHVCDQALLTSPPQTRRKSACYLSAHAAYR